MSAQDLAAKITQEVYSLTFHQEDADSIKWRRLGEAKLERLLDKSRSQWQESLDDIQRIKADYDCENKHWLEWRNKNAHKAGKEVKQMKASEHTAIISELTTELEMAISKEFALNNRINLMTDILSIKQKQRKKKEDDKLSVWARSKRVEIEQQITALAMQLPIIASFITKDGLIHMGTAKGFAHNAVAHCITDYDAAEANKAMLPEYRAAALKEIEQAERAEKKNARAKASEASNAEIESETETDQSHTQCQAPATEAGIELKTDTGSILRIETSATRREDYGVFGECTSEVPEAFKDMAANK